MADKDETPSGTGNPAGPGTANENAAPTLQEIHELTRRILSSLSYEKQVQLRNDVTRSMSEEQRRQFSAAKADPLQHFVFRKARQDITTRRASRQVDNSQQQQGTNQSQPLVASQREPGYADVPASLLAMLATQPFHDDLNTAAATSSLQSSPVVNANLHPDNKCASCGPAAALRFSAALVALTMSTNKTKSRSRSTTAARIASANIGPYYLAELKSQFKPLLRTASEGFVRLTYVD